MPVMMFCLINFRDVDGRNPIRWQPGTLLFSNLLFTTLELALVDT